jgi:hypothetical protein
MTSFGAVLVGVLHSIKNSEDCRQRLIRDSRAAGVWDDPGKDNLMRLHFDSYASRAAHATGGERERIVVHILAAPDRPLVLKRCKAAFSAECQ